MTYEQLIAKIHQYANPNSEDYSWFSMRAQLPCVMGQINDLYPQQFEQAFDILVKEYPETLTSVTIRG